VLCELALTSVRLWLLWDGYALGVQVLIATEEIVAFSADVMLLRLDEFFGHRSALGQRLADPLACDIYIQWLAAVASFKI